MNDQMLLVSENHQFVASTKDFEFAYIRNIFESKNLFQVVVMLKGCHDVEPFKEGLVFSSRDTLEEAKEDMNKLIKSMIDSTGIKSASIE